MVDPILIPILAITFTVGVPAIALATHLVLRPLVRDIIGAIQANKAGSSDDVERRLVRLEDAFYQLDESVTRLLEVETFRRELEAGKKEHRDEGP
jgi:hypothetical protein